MEEVKEQSQESKTDDANAQKKEDYESKYKEAQAKYQQEIERLNAEIESNKQMLDAVTPYVDWEAAQGKKTPEQDIRDQEYLDKRTVEEMRRKDRELTENEILELRFEVANPDLKPYIKLVRAELQEARMKNPRATKKQLLDMAAENTRKFLESEREKVKKEQEEVQRKEDELLVSGLDSPGNTPPAKEEKAQTNEEYAAERRAELARRKGM